MRLTTSRRSSPQNLGRALRSVVPAVLFALLLHGCAGSPKFPTISPAQLAEELRFQKDLTEASLQQALAQEENLEKEMARLNAEKSEVEEALRLEQERAEELSGKVDTVGQDVTEIQAELERARRLRKEAEDSFQKLREVARGTIEEVTLLKQKNEGLVREKIELIEKNSRLDREIERLSTEMDDLRADFIRKSGTGGSLARKPPPPPRPEPETAGDENARVVTVVKVEKPAPLDMLGLAERAGEILQKRFDRVVKGQVAWDGLDIVLASLLGFFLLSLLYVVARHQSRKKLKRELDQYRQYYGQGKAQAQARAPEPEPEVEVQHFEVPASPAEETMVPDDASQTINIPLGAARREEQPTPEEFSPIFRSSGAPSRPAPQPEPAAADDALATMQVNLGGGPVQRESERKVIGAWSEQPERGEGTTPTLTSSLNSPAEESSPPAEYDYSQTEMISGLDVPDEPAPPAKPTSGGTQDEKVLLDELKSIISKKLES